MELRLAVLGGVIPATILGLVLLAASWLARPRKPCPKPPIDPQPVSPGASGVTEAAFAEARIPRIGLAWLVGFLLALPLIHFATWSWPRLWPVDATARLLHSGGGLAAWGFIEIALGGTLRASKPGRATAHGLRWVGRTGAIGLVLWLLLSPFESVVGTGAIVAGVATGALVTLMASLAVDAGQCDRHPSLVWGALFLSGIGAMVVLLLGRTATAAQASAGMAALAAATGVALLVFRRAVPGSVVAFVWSGTLAWLLSVGCFATGQTNLLSSVLLLVVPIGWAVPQRMATIDLLWKRLRLGTAAGMVWTLLCVGGAVVVAWMTRGASAPGY